MALAASSTSSSIRVVKEHTAQDNYITHPLILHISREIWWTGELEIELHMLIE